MTHTVFQMECMCTTCMCRCYSCWAYIPPLGLTYPAYLILLATLLNLIEMAYYFTWPTGNKWVLYGPVTRPITAYLGPYVGVYVVKMH